MLFSRAKCQIVYVPFEFQGSARSSTHANNLYFLSVINNSPRFSTSAGDPEKIGTYISGDSRFDNNDFPNMNRTKFEVQSNIIFDSSVGKYYPYLYMRDTSTRNPGMVRQLAGSEDLSTVINTLKQTVSPTLVQTYLLQYNAR